MTPFRTFRGAVRFAASAVLFLLPAVPAALPAQTGDTTAVDPRPAPECFRFVFGAWDPPLDWERSGHRGPPGPGEQGAHGRENAVRTERDVAAPMLLFPSFWPAGVLVRFEGASGDTLRATASALVADASVEASRAPVTAIRVACAAPRP